MKTFNILAVLSLLIATAGITYTNGEANVISVISCIPLAGFVGALLISAIQNWIKGNK